MARRRREVYVRKLIRLGKVSSAVVLPKVWVEAQGLKPGDQVYIRLKEDGTLEIGPAVSPIERLRKQTLIIYADRCGDPNLIARNLIGAYINGIINLKIVRSDRAALPSEVIETVHKIASRFDEMYIKKEVRNVLELQIIHSEETVNVNEKISELLMHVYSELEHLALALEKRDKRHLEEVLKIEELIDRLYYILLRRLLLVQRGRLPAELFGLESVMHVIGNRRILGILELTSDFMADIARELMENLDVFDEEISKTISSLLHEIRKPLPDIVRGFNPPDMELANQVLNELAVIEAKLKETREKIAEKVRDVKKAVLITTVLTRLVDAVRLLSGVCEVIINRALESPERWGRGLVELQISEERT